MEEITWPISRSIRTRSPWSISTNLALDRIDDSVGLLAMLPGDWPLGQILSDLVYHSTLDWLGLVLDRLQYGLVAGLLHVVAVS